ncbi:zf-HC2 domain-containing protein [Aurantimonas sp. Leaf443]|uniref:anti-sigma factor family protein n=1 Tax=Aurantimonas sp. Leaf443 TaxID=1736378 RepID=UPI0006F20C7E|nr:zf-HC2 domain-containing protein [Aurantimonas sp. Leaf443]KQT83164.1 Fis family transcriptional regulator [Aurantimonas sp. Leaf443]
MERDADPVIESDLIAYVDGELTPARRIAVEAHLSGHPAEAARVMADLRDRDALRLALAAPGRGLFERPATAQAARRLAAALRRARYGEAARRVAAVALLVGFGWLAHAGIGPLGVRQSVASSPPPDFVSEAFMAHRTSELRASMASLPEATGFDPAEILAATAIALPRLPKDWQVRDAQVFPSPFGPSVELTLASPDLGALSLFAVRPGRFDVSTPAVSSEGEASAAHWQLGDVAYALVASKARRSSIEHAARDLADTLY